MMDHLKLKEGWTDKQIRDCAAANTFNGKNTSEVCRTCGAYTLRHDSDVVNCKIIDTCKWCFEIQK